MKGWPVIEYKPQKKGTSDQTLEEMLIDLERLKRSGYMRAIAHGGEKGYHIKLVLDNKHVVSLFVWNTKIFQGKPTLIRSYGVWPIDVINIDEKRGDRAIAEGRYQLKSGLFMLQVERSYDTAVPAATRVYHLRLARVREYVSKKHGWSVRPEYYAVPARVE